MSINITAIAITAIICITVAYLYTHDSGGDNEKSKIICIDIETTGLNRDTDEILQVAIINGRGKTLYNSYIRPDKLRSWKEAEAINKISWQAVKNAPTIRREKRKIERILKRAGLIIGYNLKGFDLPFMAAKGINTAVKADIFDVMLEFAPVAGEYDEKHDCFKWKPLVFCADWYGYTNYKPHDALEDVRATLHCYYAMQRGGTRCIDGRKRKRLKSVSVSILRKDLQSERQRESWNTATQ